MKYLLFVLDVTMKLNPTLCPWLATVLILPVFVMSACGGGDASEPTPESFSAPGTAVSSVSEMPVTKPVFGGVVLDDVIWSQLDIPVCWALNPDDFDRYATKRERVRQAIAESWQAESAVRFTGWQACDSNEADIAISIGLEERSNMNGYSKYGKSSLNAYPSMTIKLSTLDGSRLAGTAIHEFGHALGFAHTQDRPDTPLACLNYIKQTYPNISGAVTDQIAAGHMVTVIGQWDSQSVMNYCNEARRTHPMLSEGDKQMVKKYYGDASGFSYSGAITRSDFSIFDEIDAICEAPLEEASGESDATLMPKQMSETKPPF